MESNWRYNVWDLGFTGRGYRLIARLDEPFEGFEYLCNRVVNSGTALLMTPLIFENDQLVDQFTIIPVQKGFPHGFKVEPDTV